MKYVEERLGELVAVREVEQVADSVVELTAGRVAVQAVVLVALGAVVVLVVIVAE